MKGLALLLIVATLLSACASVVDVAPSLSGAMPRPDPGNTPPSAQSRRAGESLEAQAVAGMAPDFTLRTLDGKQVTLSDLRGRPVLINFWATWCPPCRLEMPAMQRVYERHKDEGLVILAVNYRETEEQVRPFVEELGLTFSILLDRDGNVANQYRVLGLPTTYFVDRTGRVRQVRVGAMSEDFMETNVQELLR